ncbi:MAG: phosphopantothenoylcysteine decarboxylase, partial [Congregibacter sp.]|nr:phosphopantothenoylcysteine decarboxylase [Congregibacter sp.]
ALARAALEAGATVHLVSGPVALAVPDRVSCEQVTTAQDMLDACMRRVADCDIFIGCAAVADYRPAMAAEQKIKKSDTEMSLQLLRNPDVLASVAAHKPRPFSVGFAAETQQLREHALGKLERKGLDMIVANDVSDRSIGFNSDSNAALLLWRSTESNADNNADDNAGSGNQSSGKPATDERTIEECSKDVLAGIVIAQIAALLPTRS